MHSFVIVRTWSAVLDMTPANGGEPRFHFREKTEGEEREERSEKA